MSEFLREVKGILSALCILEDGKQAPAKYQDQQGRILYAWAQSLVSEVADKSRPQAATPSGHATDCDWHVDQYPWECTCGYERAER